MSEKSEILSGNFFKFIKPVSKYAPFAFAGGVYALTRDFNMTVGTFVLAGVGRHLGRGEGVFDTVKMIENDPEFHQMMKVADAQDEERQTSQPVPKA